MDFPRSTLILGAAVLAAASYALGRETAPAEPSRIIEARPQAPLEPAVDTEGTDPAEEDPSAAPGSSQGFAPDTEPAAIAWTVPSAWHTVPNASSMRIATHAVPHVAADSSDAELSISRAGGDLSSNIQRWAGQFEGAGETKQRSHKANGLDVTVVEIEGTYTNGMDPGAKPRPGWALLAAIVQTAGLPYFFKMTGPAATVHAARGAFTTMIDGIHPTGQSAPL